MRPLDEHVVMIGPWGWIGWMLYVVAMAALGLLWKSSGPSKLRELQRELSKARDVIEALEERGREMLKVNAKLREDYQKLHGEYLELRGQFSQLNVDYGKMDAQIHTLRQELNDEREKREAQFMELMRAKAKSGDL